MKIIFDISDKLAQIISMVFAPATIMRELSDIKEKLNSIMQTQEEFDAKITEANSKLDSIATDVTNISDAVTNEAQQIADFIAANPSINTSALDGVVARLGAAADSLSGTADSVSGIFTPPEAPAPTEPAPSEPAV